MAIQTFYTNTSDTDLAKDVIASKANIYIQRRVYEGTGVINVTSPTAATLTPATSPAWTVDELISTVANNLFIVDNNGVVAAAKITDNTATAITFDSTACKLESDEATAASFTGASTYSFYVLTPCSTTGQPYGPFMGYSEGVELSITQNRKSFKFGMPKQKVFTDLEETEATLSGGTINWTNTDLMQAIMGAAQYGKSSGGEMSYAIGSGASCNTSGNYYRVTFQGEDRNCRDYYVICRKVEFKLDGNIFSESEDGYSMANFNADVLADTFYPTTANMIGFKKLAT